MPKTIPAQTDVRIRGKLVQAKLTGAGWTTMQRMRALLDELADNPTAPEGMQKHAGHVRVELIELEKACRPGAPFVA